MVEIDAKKALVVVFAALIFFAGLPFVIRTANLAPVPIGEWAYYDARMAQQIIESGFKKTDVLMERPYYFNAYHFVLAGAAHLVGLGVAVVVVPVLSGIAALLFFYLTLRAFKLSYFQSACASLIFAISPALITAVALSKQDAFILATALAGFFCCTKKNTIALVLAGILLSIAASFGIFYALFIIAGVLAYGLSKKEGVARFSYIAIAVGIIALASGLPATVNAAGASFASKNKLLDFVSDFGGTGGFGIFALLLAGIGLIALWRHKQKYHFAYMVVLGLVLLSFFASKIIVYSNVVVSVFAGAAFAYFSDSRWKIKKIKLLFLTLLFCGILFSAITQSLAIATMPPSKELVSALDWLRTNTRPDDVIFAHHSQGFFVQSVALRKTLCDDLFGQMPNARDAYNDSMTIFESVDLELTKKLLKKYNASYVVLTGDLVGTIWEKEGEGLAFLVTNNETFKKVYDRDNVKIWKIKERDVE